MKCSRCPMRRVCFPPKRYITPEEYEKIKNPLGLDREKCAASIRKALRRYRKKEFEQMTHCFSVLMEEYLHWEYEYEQDPNNQLVSHLMDYHSSKIDMILADVGKKYGRDGIAKIILNWLEYHKQEVTRKMENLSSQPVSKFLG